MCWSLQVIKKWKVVFYLLFSCCNSSPLLVRNVPYFWSMWMQFPGICSQHAIFYNVELHKCPCFAAPHLWISKWELCAWPLLLKEYLASVKNGNPSILLIVWKPKVARLEPWEGKCNDCSFVTRLFGWLTSAVFPFPTSDQDSDWSCQLKSRHLLLKMCKYILAYIWALSLFKDHCRAYQ